MEGIVIGAHDEVPRRILPDRLSRNRRLRNTMLDAPPSHRCRPPPAVVLARSLPRRPDLVVKGRRVRARGRERLPLLLAARSTSRGCRLADRGADGLDEAAGLVARRPGRALGGCGRRGLGQGRGDLLGGGAEGDALQTGEVNVRDGGAASQVIVLAELLLAVVSYVGAEGLALGGGEGSRIDVIYGRAGGVDVGAARQEIELIGRGRAEAV